MLIKADPAFNVLGMWNIDCALGIVALQDGQFLVARGGLEKGKGYSGHLRLAAADDKSGLRFLDEAKPH